MLNKKESLENKLTFVEDLQNKVISGAGGLLLGLFGGAICSTYDNSTESYNSLIILSSVGTTAFLGSIAYIKFSGEGIKNKFDAISNNVINYASTMVGFSMSYFS